MNRVIKIINPGKQAGGSNMLLARTALALARRHGFTLSLVDFEDGATRRAWTAEGVQFEFNAYRPGENIELKNGEVVLMGLLGAKLFTRYLRGNLNARLVTWCTAPQDPFKYIPPSYLFNSCSWSFKRTIARLFFSSHGARIARFLFDGAKRGGVIFMDAHCHEINEAMFGPGIPRCIVPICTGMPQLKPRNLVGHTGRAYWVGRVTDFKTEPLVAMTRALLEGDSPISEVVVIGDGADINKAKLRLMGLNVRWTGYLPPEQLDGELYANADFVFGHGTALLEAAKLAIPSLLVDGAYDVIPLEKLKASWLHKCPEGYVGSITNQDKLRGQALSECLESFNESSAAIGHADYRHWLASHHPDVIAEKIASVIETGNFTVSDFMTSGAATPGWFGSVIEWVKKDLFRRRY
jgi:hypothetical protein